MSPLLQPKTFKACLAASLTVAIGFGGALSALAESDFYMLKSGGKPIGKVEVKNYRASGGEAVTEITNTNHFRREGEPFDMSTVSRFVQNGGGQPESFSYQYQLGEQDMIEAQGQVKDTGTADTSGSKQAHVSASKAGIQPGNARLELQMTRDNQRLTGQTSVAPDRFLFPEGPRMQEIYRSHGQDVPGSSFRFQTVNLGPQPQVVDTEVKVLGPEKIALAGDQKQVLKFELKNPSDNQSTVYEWRDPQGKLMKARSVGSDMEMEYASRSEIRNLDETALDLITSAQVISNVVPQPRNTKEAYYRISALNGETVNLDGVFPDSDTQKIEDAELSGLQRTAPEGIYLKVFQKEPDDALVPFPIRYDKNYLDATPYMEVNDAAIQHAAEEIIGKENRAYYAARMLRQWVYGNIKNKSLSMGFATAKETLENRSGDCTEHAVLLAALTRSLGIPSRVAVGLIYLPGTNANLGRFVYHMWTEVYIGGLDKGNWIPMDATVPQEQMDATHLKIADSALNSTDDLMRLTQRVVKLMGHIKIDVLKALADSGSVLTFGEGSGIQTTEIPKLDLTAIDIKTLSRKAIKHYRVDLPPESFSLETSEGLFTYGVEQLSKDNYDVAMDSFRKSISRLRRPIDFYHMGERLAALDLYDLADEAFNRARQMDGSLSQEVESWQNAYLPGQSLPDNLNRQFLHAVNLEINGSDPDGAAEALEQVTAGAPDFAPAYWHLGSVSRNPQQAINALQQAVAMAPGHFRYAETLGDTLMEIQHYNSAAKAYRKAADALKTQNFPQNRTWLNDLDGKIHLANGQALLAVNKRNAAGWLESGRGLLLQDRLSEAGRALSNALALQPGSNEAALYRFQVALRNSDWRALYGTAGKVAGMAGGNPLAARLLGEYRIRTRQYPLAVQTLRQAITMDPGNPDAYVLLSKAYRRIADVKRYSPKTASAADASERQAEAALVEGVKRMRSEWDRSVVDLALAELLLKHGKASQAEPYAEDALNCNRLDARAYLYKGQAQLYQGDFNAARETLEIARLLNPTDANILTQLGHAAKEQGLQNVALDFYQRAYKADPLNEEAATTLLKAMAEMHVAGKRPVLYMNLSDDERDYLVQVLFQAESMMHNAIDYFDGLKQFLITSGSEHGHLFTLAAMQGNERYVSRINKTYDEAVSSYQRLQNMNVPPRLSMLHYAITAAFYKRLELYKFSREEFSIIQPPSEGDRVDKEYEQLAKDWEAAEGNASIQLMGIKAQLPEAVFNGVVYEAQLDNIPELRNRKNQLVKEIAELFDKDKKKNQAPNGQNGNQPPQSAQNSGH